MRLFIIAAVLVAFVTTPLAADWRESLTPDNPGPFPEVGPFRAEFRFGWSEIEAARATVSLQQSDTTTSAVGSGGTVGMARLLYQIDASLDALCSRPDLRTIRSVQKEVYSKKTITTRVEQRAGALEVFREKNPPGDKPARWKVVKFTPVRDLFAAMLFIRSQRLAPGDSVKTVVFPGDAAFLVEMNVLGTGPVTVGGTPRDAIRLDLRIHRINLKKGGVLEEHTKFRGGTVWLSNDKDRIPLRAEVNIFVGYVFAELVSLQKSDGSAL